MLPLHRNQVNHEQVGLRFVVENRKIRLPLMWDYPTQPSQVQTPLSVLALLFQYPQIRVPILLELPALRFQYPQIRVPNTQVVVAWSLPCQQKQFAVNITGLLQ